MIPQDTSAALANAKPHRRKSKGESNKWSYGCCTTT